MRLTGDLTSTRSRRTPASLGALVRIVALGAAGSVASAADPALEARVNALAAELVAPDPESRRRALEDLRRLGTDAIPQLLTCAGREVGTPAWEASIGALLTIDPAQALAHVETCRSSWSSYGWLTPASERSGRRVVDELVDRLLAARAAAWTKPARLEPALLDGGFRVPPWIEHRIDGALPSHLAWDDIPVRERSGKLEIDAAKNGAFATRVDPQRAAVVEIGPRERARRVLVHRRLDVWYAASPHVLRGTVGGLPVEVLDAEGDGDFAGAADLVRFGEGAFRPLAEGPLAPAEDGSLVRFRIRRDAGGWSIQTIPEPDPVWLDRPGVVGMRAVTRWRGAAGLPPVRIDYARWRACGLHHDYWRRYGFTAHDEDRDRPGYTADGEVAGKRSSCWATGDGPRFVEVIGSTVLHRVSLVGRPDDGVGFFTGMAGSMLWGGTIDAAPRRFPLLVPAPGQSGVPSICEPEVPTPTRNPTFYSSRARGFPVSVTWSGLLPALDGAVLEVFEADARRPLPGTTFSPADPYETSRTAGFSGESAIFVADSPLRSATLHTARYRGRNSAGPVEFTWQFRTQ